MIVIFFSCICIPDKLEMPLYLPMEAENNTFAHSSDYIDSQRVDLPEIWTQVDLFNWAKS